MTTRVLRLDTSLFGAGGASSQLNDALIEKLRARHGAVEVVRRDLAAAPLPYFDAPAVAALATEPAARDAGQRELAALAERLLKEVREADILVIAAPMYNFSVPSTLKTWMDWLARAGVTFRYTEHGPEGLLGGRKVFVTSSRGGLHRDSPSDAIVPLLRSYFALLGMEDVEVIYAEGLNMGGEQREKGLAAAREQIDNLAA